MPVDPHQGMALVKRLLDLKVDPNAVNRYTPPGPVGAIHFNSATTGSSPVHIAAISGKVELMKLLLDHGGDPNQLRQDGHSPLSLAAKLNDLPMVKILVSRGADVKRRYNPIDKFTGPDKTLRLA